MVDITTIPITELESDLQDSRNDISACEVVLSMGIQTYSGGPVLDRLHANRRFIEIITEELNRRAEIKEAGEQQATTRQNAADTKEL